MKIISKKEFTKAELKEIKAQVLKQIKPNTSLAQITVTIDKKEVKGTYQNAGVPTFLVGVEPTNNEKPSASSVSEVTQNELKKMKKSELQALAKKHNISFETDNNKDTLIALILPVINGAK